MILFFDRRNIIKVLTAINCIYYSQKSAQAVTVLLIVNDYECNFIGPEVNTDSGCDCHLAVLNVTPGVCCILQPNTALKLYTCTS